MKPYDTDAMAASRAILAKPRHELQAYPVLPEVGPDADTITRLRRIRAAAAQAQAQGRKPR